MALLRVHQSDHRQELTFESKDAAEEWIAAAPHFVIEGGPVWAGGTLASVTLTPCEHCFDDLYLYIDPADDELEPNLPYVARVALIMSELDTGNADIVALAQKGRTELETFLKSCAGIEVQTVEVIPNVEFTLADLDLYRPWDYSDLSLPDAD